MTKLYNSAKNAMTDQNELEENVKKSHRISVCLCNLSQLLTEFGPSKQVNSMKEIESKEVLNSEDLKERVFVHTTEKKIRTIYDKMGVMI
eukprot:CAMPEP_0176343950 /NCGR_PEP_ID=MMETSP0126-20121128/4316_1 /TAXON_ID=141414 ORGANISM="Strombidinopsis acuminatum, Strain SPMC142" /NCGR_SAMPLE_ID=MMETSP0126 /ASSEMBLY_ACC=CAM_ASM_000229 /LENGTH=89 /DNA_ID=CAMNT_0017690131 /DNA_START=1351 /DNA_END=1620 /DNA_ORIENTATION=-